jgi:hypothetical protein
MFDTQEAVADFYTLAHVQKLKKVKEILRVFAKKSSFFADVQDHFTNQMDMQESVLDAIYSMVMSMVYQQNQQNQ